MSSLSTPMLFGVAALLVAILDVAWGADNGLALTPPMGWCSWNAFHRNFDESLFYAMADALVETGMKDAGYVFLNVDGGWWNGSDTGHIYRNATGFPSYSPQKYPHGIPALVDYIHSKGLKYGHYTDAGTHACNGDRPMSEYYEKQDVALFASWGIDMIKVDACGTEEEPEVLVKRWHDLLNATGRPILFSNCHNGCQTSLGPLPSWCQEYANEWRTGADIQSTWKHVMGNLHTLVGRGAYGKPGSWNDPDFLEVGVGEFDLSVGTLAMNQAHFALWCVTSSPLIASPDLRKTPKALIEVFTDRTAIAVNQEYAGNAGDQLKATGNAEVWYKPLHNGRAAVVLLNSGDEGEEEVTVEVRFGELASLKATNTSECTVQNVWEKTTASVKGGLSVAMSARSSVFAVISNCSA